MSEAPSTPAETTPTSVEADAPAPAPEAEVEAAPVDGNPTPEASEEPAPPADPPRLAVAKRLHAEAQKKESAVAEERKALEAERQHFQAESDRVKGIIEKAWPAFELGRDLVGLKGAPAGKVLARLRAAGIDLDARSLAAAVLEPGEGDEDERPLTMRQLRALKEKERQEREQHEAEEKRRQEQAATQTRAQQEQTFLGFVASEGKSPSAARLIDALDDAGRTAVLKDAWKAVAEYQAQGRHYTTADLLERVETAAQKRLAALGLATAQPAAPAAAPAAVSNKTSGAKTPGKPPKTKEERWDLAFRDLS